MPAPFKEGDIVRSKGNEHFGEMVVTDVRWIDYTNPGVPHYWSVQAEQMREQPDPASYPSGTCGIIGGGRFTASSDEFDLVR